jgi:hypothetical protein
MREAVKMLHGVHSAELFGILEAQYFLGNFLDFTYEKSRGGDGARLRRGAEQHRQSPSG